MAWRALRWWESAGMSLEDATDANDRKEMEDAPYTRIEDEHGKTIVACHDLSRIAREHVALIVAAPEMRKILTTIVDDDPFDDDADEGPFCKFLCGATDRSKPHPDDCAWAQARALLARIDLRETT